MFDFSVDDPQRVENVETSDALFKFKEIVVVDYKALQSSKCVLYMVIGVTVKLRGCLHNFDVIVFPGEFVSVHGLAVRRDALYRWNNASIFSRVSSSLTVGTVGD
jgi:hypothetical protein